MAEQPGSARFEAFGCEAVLAVADADALGAARGAVDEVIADFDLACSRFRDDSEITRLNEAAGTAFAAGPVLIEAVSAALRAARLTDGAVDPTIGQALIALGYDRDFAAIGAPGSAAPAGPVAAPLARIESVPGWRTVEVDEAAATIRVPRGVILDLGATAKALAADRAAQRAAAVAECGALVSFGGDMAIVGEPPRAGWRIRVTDDHRADAAAPGQWITLHGSCGLATSSTTVRRWNATDGPVHHLVDPATGGSVDSRWRTVSVNAATCLDANTAATAAIVRGDRALTWLADLGLPSRLVSVEGRAEHVAGWPAEGDDLS